MSPDDGRPARAEDIHELALVPDAPTPGGRVAGGPAGMSTLFETAARRRLPFLLGSLVVAVLLAIGRGPAGDVLSDILFATALVLYLGLVVTATAALSYRPRRLVERPGELTTVVGPAPVLISAGLTLLATGLIGDDLRDWRAGGAVETLDVGLTALLPSLVAVSWYTALGSFGVTLKSDGIHERRPFATMFVPWDALDPADAAGPGRYNTVNLRIRHPEAVVRRGLRDRSATVRSATDAAYLAGVINAALATRAARR